jgi:hypothetical protein
MPLKKILNKICKWAVRVFGITLLVIALGLLFNIWQERPLPVDWKPPQSPYYDFSIVFHVHSTYSYDGGGPIREILADTRKSGADILMLNEHNTIGPFADGWEGWNDEVFVIAGVEVSSPVGHYGYLTRSTFSFPFSESENMAPMATRGSDSTYIFLCHPQHPQNPIRDMTV